jgi:hypothetical protein
MKSKFFLLVIIVSSLMLGTKVSAQYEVSQHYLGPCLGLSFLGSTFQPGLNYEYSLSAKSIGLDASGKLGVGGIFRYWGYSENFGAGKWKYSNVLLGAQGNYHFHVSDSKWDPYLGLVLALDVASTSWDGVKDSYWSDKSAGGLWLALQGGVRYFLSPKLALTGRFGFGTLSYGALEIGVDFKL